MKRIHAQGSLAPRDIVSRGIHQTMQDFGLSCVYLDISFKNSEWLQNRFPSIYSSCLVGGIDITKEPIPVVPAAHYSCGGIGVNLDGRTSLKRLYAAGEVAYRCSWGQPISQHFPAGSPGLVLPGRKRCDPVSRRR